MGSIKYDDYIKQPYMEHSYTQEQILELHKCAADPMYFIENYIKIVNPNNGVVLFDAYPYQRHMIKTFEENRFVVCLLSRQSGKSTIVAAYALWFACFNDHKNIGIVSNKADSAKSLLARLKYMYELLPAWIKPGVPEWAQKTIAFDNHTKIHIAATSKDSFRGEPMSMLLLDEFGFVDPPWKAEEFWASNYPTVSASKTAKILIISTANGMNNKFHEIYTNAENGTNSFVSLKYDWRHVPDRDDEWAATQLSNMGKIKFAVEFGCDFIGSSFTVIDAETLENMLKTTKDPAFFDMKSKFRIFEKPQAGAEYVIGVDCAKGTGQDASVMQIFRIDSIHPIKLTQVAVYEDNFVDVYTFAEIVHKTSYYYNSAYLMVENNGEGSAVTNRLWWDLENSNLVNTGTKEKDLGIRATTTTKPKAVLFMKKLIEDGSITIHDKPTVMQLTDFIDKGNNVYRCENLHDDLVASMYWSFYFFEMNIMEEKYTFKEGEIDDDTWGVLSDVNTVEEDWSWL